VGLDRELAERQAEPTTHARSHRTALIALKNGLTQLLRNPRPGVRDADFDAAIVRDDKIVAGCHRPRGPDGTAQPPACLRCHQKTALGGLHQSPTHVACTTCRPAHEPRPFDDRTTCTGCHKDQPRARRDALRELSPVPVTRIDAPRWDGLTQYRHVHVEPVPKKVRGQADVCAEAACGRRPTLAHAGDCDPIRR